MEPLHGKLLHGQPLHGQLHTGAGCAETNSPGVGTGTGAGVGVGVGAGAGAACTPPLQGKHPHHHSFCFWQENPDGQQDPDHGASTQLPPEHPL